MISPVPVFGQIPDDDIQHWVRTLNQQLPQVSFRSLNQLTSTEKQNVRFAVVANPTVDQLKSLPALEWVQSIWAGVEKLVDTFVDTDIQLTRLIDPQLSATMAECALTWCLYLNRDMHLYQQDQQQRVWQPRPYRAPEETTIGILGLGELGQRCALRLQQNGFRICSWSQSPRDNLPFRHFYGEQQLGEVLGQSDIILNLLPLTPATRGLLNKTTLKHCVKEARLINFGRGPTVSEPDLIAALDQGALEFAVLDVFDEEPLAPEHPFWTHPAVRVLPHVSAPTSRVSAAKIVAQNMTKMIEGKELPPFVDLKRGY